MRGGAPILTDRGGGVEVCADASRCGGTTCRPDTSAHLAFRVNRASKYRLRVRPETWTAALPYQIYIDVKPYSTSGAVTIDVQQPAFD